MTGVLLSERDFFALLRVAETLLFFWNRDKVMLNNTFHKTFQAPLRDHIHVPVLYLLFVKIAKAFAKSRTKLSQNTFIIRLLKISNSCLVVIICKQERRNRKSLLVLTKIEAS
jgi:hypothetical protein